MAGSSPTVTDTFLDDPERAGGVRSALGREILAIVLFLGAVFVGLSLITPAENRSLIGPVGQSIAGALRFVFGFLVAWGAPAVLVLASVHLFRQKATPRGSIRILGIIGLVVSACALLALPGADIPELREETFHRGGMIGVFLVDAEGMGLAWQMGTVGAVLVLGGVALVSFLLAGDLLLATLFEQTGALWLRWRAHRLAVSQARMAGEEPAMWRSRLFPPEAGESEEAGAYDSEPEEEEEVVAAAPSRRRRRRWSIFGTAATPDLFGQEGFDTIQGGSAADAIGLGLPRAARGAVDEADPDLHEEVIDEGQPSSSFHPNIIDGFSPLPISETGRDDSLWEEEEVDGEAVEDEIEEEAQDELTPAEARMLRRLAGRRGRVAEEEEEDADGEDGEEEFEEGEEFVGADDDPLFESADEAKRLGIAAATGQVPTAFDQEATEPPRASLAPGVMSDNTFLNYRLPAVELLDDPPKVDSRIPREELLEISNTLEKTLNDFGIQAKVIQVVQGPVVTRFELKPAPGVKVSRITSLEQDITMAMRATNPVRILAPIPGKAAVGIEVPNRRRAGVYLKELVSHDDFWCHKSPLAFALGKSIEGEPYFADLSRMPHLLLAGATGAGKSVCVNAIICSILYRMKPDQVKLLFVDPKRVELALYQDIPHLLAPVVSDPKRAAGALAWAVEQMEERYETLVEYGQRNIDGYNAIVADPSKSPRTQGRRLLHMPHMVIVLDELADLMVVAKTDVEEHIQRLAQMARAVGIHLIVATQRPSVNVITGVIKANFPARIAFQVSSKADSRVILDMNGAETLLGRGDMLFHPGGAPKPMRIQGCFVSEAEVERLVTHIKTQGESDYVIQEFEMLRDEKGRPLPKRGGASVLWDEDIDDDIEAQGERRGTNRTMGSVSASGNFVPHAGGSAWAGDEEIDEALVRGAARLILENRKASVSLLQRRMKVGFARAGRLMDMLEEIGIVGPFQGSKPRDILVDPDKFLAEMDEYEAGKE